MKRLLTAALLFWSAPALANGWISSGIVTNPTASQVLDDTGPITGPTQITFCLVASSTVAAIVDLQLVDSTGATVRNEQYFSIPANDTRDFCLPDGMNVTTAANGDHLRIINVTAITGKVAASLWQD